MEHTEFERLAPILRTRAKRVGEDFFSAAEQAEDVAQETMIRLWKAWPSLSSPLEAERLAIRIAKHECIDAWRREQRRPHSSLTISHETALPASEEGQTLEESELKEGMAPKEIAIATGINVRTVSSMLSHARHIIYNILKEGGYIEWEKLKR